VDSFWDEAGRAELTTLSEIINIQAAAINNAFEGANRDIFGAMDGNNYLATIGMTPFLMAAGLSN
jgi:hypothetical protein